MINLAGNADCDRTIQCELDRCRIESVTVERSTGEVSSAIEGRLGQIRMRRAWTYWVADGQVPLHVAQELYADPVGKTDVRVDGHCGCPAPEYPHVVRLDASGRKLVLDPTGEQLAQFVYFADTGLFSRKHVDRYTFVRWQSDMVRLTESAFVDLYHIDTEIGLRLFADTMRKHGVAQ